MKSLQILSRFEDIRNGKDKILKCGAYLNNYYIVLLAGLNCIWNQYAKNKKNIVDNLIFHYICFIDSEIYVSFLF